MFIRSLKLHATVPFLILHILHSHVRVSQSGRGGSSLIRQTQTSHPSATSTRSSGRTPRCSQASREMQSLHRVLGLPRGLLPVGHARKRPGGILTRCHLNWLLAMWRSSNSVLSLSRMTELLTLSLKESPATFWRKLISAACIPDIIHSVTTHSS